MWASAQKNDIGAGYRRATKAAAKSVLIRGNTKAERKIHAIYSRLNVLESEDERKGYDRHKFLNGNSRFIFYVLKPPTIIKKPKRKALLEKKAINAKTTVSPATRLKFTTSLGENIDRTTKFFVEEILPKTESLLTASANIDEIMQQVAEEPAKLPLDFIKRKMMDAVNLRIVRYICSQYGLTKTEQRLMLAEWFAKSKPPLF